MEAATDRDSEIIRPAFFLPTVAGRKRARALFSLLPGLLATALFPTAADADVLEISASGATWIAGGPSSAIADQSPLAPEEGPHHPALTEAAPAAGPAQWRPRIAELSAKYDLSPALLEALVWQESRWNPRAVSPVGARGLAQLMPGTAKEMGVNADDPNANLEGGARYLRLQLNAFNGDLENALAAYNAGPARVARAGGVPRIAETQAYVASILSRLANPVRR